MPLSEPTLSALQQLLSQDKELLAQVQASSHTAQAANLIANAAVKAGIEVNVVDLAEHFANAAKTATSQALSDQQLETVAGGASDGDWSRLSLLTRGWCATVSIMQALEDKRYC